MRIEHELDVLLSICLAILYVGLNGIFYVIGGETGAFVLITAVFIVFPAVSILLLFIIVYKLLCEEKSRIFQRIIAAIPPSIIIYLALTGKIIILMDMLHMDFNV